MPKIAIVDKMHQDGINLLKNNPKFECEVIEDLSKKNLISKLPVFDGITLRRGKIDAEILEKCKKIMEDIWSLFFNKDYNLLQKNISNSNDLFVNPVDIGDNNIPNGNSIYLLICSKLNNITNDQKWFKKLALYIYII